MAAVATDVPPAMAEDVPEAPVVFAGCEGVAVGMVNGFTVDGTARAFILTLPSGATGAGGRWPVVFNWHGLGDNPANMNQLLAGQVDNPTMPFVLVTPASTGLGPTTNPLGLEWEQLRARNPNRKARLFDAVLGCLDRRWGVDRDRVYTVGFSAGAIMSDLLGVLRGDQLAAVATYSGGYFNPANLCDLAFFTTRWTVKSISVWYITYYLLDAGWSLQKNDEIEVPVGTFSGYIVSIRATTYWRNRELMYEAQRVWWS